jgi:hypothetical protein
MSLCVIIGLSWAILSRDVQSVLVDLGGKEVVKPLSLKYLVAGLGDEKESPGVEVWH